MASKSHEDVHDIHSDAPTCENVPFAQGKHLEEPVTLVNVPAGLIIVDIN